MATTRKSTKPASTAKPKARSAAVKKAAKPSAAPKAATPKKGETLALADVMALLESAGSEQTRKTYGRHGATGPMFGVPFGFLGKLWKRIRFDHDLALKLWKTGNVDARNLAMKIADATLITSAELDQWARENPMRMCGLYIASLTQESGQGQTKAKAWLASKEEKLRATGWAVIGVLSNRDEEAPDETFKKHLATIEKSIHSEANEVKAAMNGALIAIGGRSPALRKTATAAAKRIGKVEVDHGPTACETPDAAAYLDKMWGYSAGRFPSPAAAERSRDSMRTRC